MPKISRPWRRASSLILNLVLVIVFTTVSAKRDPYEVLGLSRRASDSNIKSRWRDLARKLHPDKQGAHMADPEEKERIETRFNEVR